MKFMYLGSKYIMEINPEGNVVYIIPEKRKTFERDKTPIGIETIVNVAIQTKSSVLDELKKSITNSRYIWVPHDITEVKDDFGRIWTKYRGKFHCENSSILTVDVFTNDEKDVALPINTSIYIEIIPPILDQFGKSVINHRLIDSMGYDASNIPDGYKDLMKSVAGGEK